MALERRSYTQAEEIALTTQVESCCPLCGKSLFYKKLYKKKTRTYRFYELAHIFPLNPTAVEAEELKDVALLSADQNDPPVHRVSHATRQASHPCGIR